MEKSEAKKIVQDMVMYHFYSEGVNDTIDKDVVDRLKNYKLKDMILASEIVSETNGEKYIGEDGKEYTRMQMNVDDRLIAAIYVLFNYRAESSNDCTPIVSEGKKGVYVVN